MNALINYKELINPLTNLNISEIEDEVGGNSIFVASKPNNKRLTLLINYFTYLANGRYKDLDMSIIGDLIEFAVNSDNIIVPYLPIYSYNNCTYSVNDKRVTVEEYKNFINNNNIALYYIGINNDIFNKDEKYIYIRYNKLKDK